MAKRKRRRVDDSERAYLDYERDFLTAMLNANTMVKPEKRPEYADEVAKALHVGRVLLESKRILAAGLALVRT